jgi:hypothetical protein
MMISTVNQITNPPSARLDKIHPFRFFNKTVINAAAFRIPDPISMKPGVKKSLKNPCMLSIGISINLPSGARARRKPPE